MQKYQPKKYRKNKKIIEFIVDETEIKDGSELIWFWVVIEPNDKEILAVDISKEQNMFVVAERFLSHVLDKYGKHKVPSDGGGGGGTWYPPQACKFLNLYHHLHSSFEKSIIERTVQYIKDRIENFDDYFFPCKKKNKCKLNHINNGSSCLLINIIKK